MPPTSADRFPAGNAADLSAAEVVRLYHQRTKHRFDAYAPGPDMLDWEAQPAAFRHFDGAPSVALPLAFTAIPDSALALALRQPFGGLGAGGQPAVPRTLGSLGALLHLAFGITAWKSYGPDRWAVRANPSSGNLHPVEAYVVARGIAGLADGVYHYRPDDHCLEQRAAFAHVGPSALHVGLTAVMWREAWKYGERAFRYCQLDLGHALAGLGYAAAVLGWKPMVQAQLGHDTLARLLGVDRAGDFPVRQRARADTECEEAEVLVALGCAGAAPAPADGAALLDLAATAVWRGTASTIDVRPLYRWPIIDEVADATRRADVSVALVHRDALPLARQSLPGALPLAVDVILRRRSAQRFDAQHVMARPCFAALLDAVLPGTQAPWELLEANRRINLVLFVHRVDGLAPGVYLLLRDTGSGGRLLARLAQRFTPQKVTGLPADIDLRQLAPVATAELHRLARSLHCHQEIASSACLAIGMLAEFDGPARLLADDPASYRDLYRAAGLLGQALYLTAEATGLRGTGIGCFFDDPVHALLGLDDTAFQSLYHFTIGLPIDDPRIEASAAYPDSVLARTLP
jgi:SagB-type dehydrogenase family enzyme